MHNQNLPDVDVLLQPGFRGRTTPTENAKAILPRATSTHSE